jgi:hypothetical protein
LLGFSEFALANPLKTIYAFQGMAGEGEESTGVAGVSLRIVHNLSFSKSVDDAAGLKP